MFVGVRGRFFGCMVMQVLQIFSTAIHPVTLQQMMQRSLQKCLHTSLLTSLVVVELSASKVSSMETNVTSTDSVMSLNSAVSFVNTHCRTFLDASRESGRFLYRGSITPSDVPLLRRLEPDLMKPGTYPDSPIAAANYFSALNAAMLTERLPVSPLYRHLTTSDVMGASKWGAVELVWPVDSCTFTDECLSDTHEQLHFATLRSPQLKKWWSADWALPQPSDQRPAFFWRDKAYLRRFVQEEVSVDNPVELHKTLSRGGEVLFSSDIYLAVPISLEVKLAKALGITPYSETTRVSLAKKAMELDGEGIRTLNTRKFIVYQASNTSNAQENHPRDQCIKSQVTFLKFIFFYEMRTMKQIEMSHPILATYYCN